MVEKTTDIILVITGFLLIVLSSALLVQKTNNRLSRNLLAAFLLTKTTLIFRWSAFRFGIFSSDSYYTYYSSLAIFLLLAPLLYLYIKSICYKNYSLKFSESIHVIPSGLFLLLMIANVYVQLNIGEENYSGLVKFLANYDLNIFWTVNFIQILVYIVLIIRLLNKYRREIANQYSSIEKIGLNWITTLLILISLHWLFIVTRGLLSFFDFSGTEVIKLLDVFSISIFLVFVTYLIFKGLSQLKIETGIYERMNGGSTKLSPQDAESLAEKVMGLMKQEKLYRTPSLTIVDISEKMEIPVWQLSHVLNEYFRKNFFNFINSFRVEEAKELLKTNGKEQRTILEILYEVGFNSKSTFNSVFKIHTGMTPSEYKRTFTAS